MTRICSAVALFLAPLIALAADVDAPPPPPTDVSPWGLIIFAVVFVGMVGGFFAYIWWKERAKKQAGGK